MKIKGLCYRRVVQNSTDIHILDLVKGVHGLDCIGKDFMKHKTDSCATTQLIRGDFIGGAVNCGSEFIAKLSDDIQDQIAVRGSIF